jgi:2-polyprenyl-3-methyl-5-hydroxy-6-metoxy-1,4-benzoquinol methylase
LSRSHYAKVADSVISLWKDLGDCAGLEVFDAGAGEGDMSRALLALGMKVTASTIAREPHPSFPEAARLLTGVDLNQPWPIPDASVDGVNLKDVIEHLENPVHVIGEVARVLRPGGVLVLSTPNMLNASSRVRFAVTGFYEGRKRPASYAKGTGDAGNFYIPPLHLLHFLMARRGLSIEKTALGPPFVWNSLFFAVALYPVFWLGATLATSLVRRRSMLRRDNRKDVSDEELRALQLKQRAVLARLRKLMLGRDVLLGRDLIFRARLTGASPFDV